MFIHTSPLGNEDNIPYFIEINDRALCYKLSSSSGGNYETGLQKMLIYKNDCVTLLINNTGGGHVVG